MNVRYLRVQVRYSGKTGKPVGIFGACWHLLRGSRLNEEESAKFLAINEWFKEHLPEPSFYEHGNPDKAITWFKVGLSDQMVTELQPLMDLLDKYHVQYDIVLSNYPGTIIYEDKYQVGVI
ncbi:hypothetical protein OB236_23660 [Paenibacillus sp. WQ 127069]|uniref:Uncharacterized protein n=1 Tax=Paenibacillus baimaensis TaxID=2982185 RepID=A0ABT2UKE2_9BACL|nr:hypothetical protein [Paenibacillus sp. WQ 127069]MCU6795110.1 hypothetical protein [Paenibacillus sp. WQ 127069]